MFAAGSRPDHSAIRAFSRSHNQVSISFDPQQGSPLRLVESDGTLPLIADSIWVELICAGLTFDLTGLAPAGNGAVPPADHFIDFPTPDQLSEKEALWLVPGSHLSGGETSIPVLRGVLQLACDMVRHFGHLEAVFWPQSQSVIGRRFFESSVSAWLDGGAFPALGLTAFHEVLDGGLSSIGLDYLIGQELWIDPAIAADKVAATRLGIRLVNHLVLLGGISTSETIMAPDGKQLSLTLSQSGKVVQVQNE